MRVFILCTGRSGSLSFINACKFIQNYTQGHESNAKQIGQNRLSYPDQHIEADNRLSWFLGDLDKQYGNEAFYVHLIREKEACVNSFNKRWDNQGSILNAFASGILMQKISKLSNEERLKVAAQYYDTVNSNIDFFLKDKDHKMTAHLETLTSDFVNFWSQINAEGDLDSATQVFDQPLNAGPPKSDIFFNRIFKK